MSRATYIVVVFGVLIAVSYARTRKHDENVKREAFPVEGRGMYGPELVKKMRALTNAVTKAKSKINHVELKATPEMGIGLNAAKTLKKGEIYLSIPIDMCISYSAAMASPIKDVLEQVQNTVSDGVSLTIKLFLLYEKFNPKSKYRAYIDMLPTELAVPFMFDDAELAELAPSGIADVAKSTQVATADEYRMLRQNVLQHHPERFPLDTFTEAEWFWAHAMYNSRVINLQNWRGPSNDRGHLIPMIDMINCREDTDERSYTAYDEATRSIVMRADNDFAQGEQIFETYGNKSNYELFLYNGFVYIDNPNNCVDVRLKVPADDAHEKQRQVLRVKRNHEFQECMGTDAAKRPSKRILNFVNVMSTPDADLPNLSNDLAKRTFTAEVEAKGRSLLRSLLVEYRKKYKTTIEEDQTRLEGDGVNPRLRNILQYRIEDMKNLDKLIKWLA